MERLIDNNWFACNDDELNHGDLARVKEGNGSYREFIYNKKDNLPIMVTVSLDKTNCAVGDTVDYDITFSESITVPYIVPISVSDRNGNHVTNIGCTVTDGTATGSFTMERAGDFTVTDEAINFHHTVIEAPLKLTNQPWLRVYQ